MADDFFAVEADGLKAMREAGARTPEVLAFGRNEDGKSFLLMTYVRPSRPRRDYWQNLGHMLAAMHICLDEGQAFRLLRKQLQRLNPAEEPGP